MQYITKLLFTDSGRLAAIFLKAVFRAAETQRVMKLLLSEYVNHFSQSLCAVGPVRRGETHDERLHVAIIRGPEEHMARPLPAKHPCPNRLPEREDFARHLNRSPGIWNVPSVERLVETLRAVKHHRPIFDVGDIPVIQRLVEAQRIGKHLFHIPHT